MNTIGYLHLLDGHAASFDGYQICFFTKARGVYLASSLAQIRREQDTSARNRQRDGLSASRHEYSYVRVVER
jgi:hypothetical protein